MCLNPDITPPRSCFVDGCSFQILAFQVVELPLLSILQLWIRTADVTTVTCKNNPEWLTLRLLKDCVIIHKKMLWFINLKSIVTFDSRWLLRGSATDTTPAFSCLWQKCTSSLPWFPQKRRAKQQITDVCLSCTRKLAIGKQQHNLLTFASSPGRMSRTDVWISLDVSVFLLLFRDNRTASSAIRSKVSLTNEFMMDIARLEMPVSGWTCFNTYSTRAPTILH